MFYYIANQDFQSYKKGDIVAKFEQFVANEFTTSGQVDVIESESHLFPKVEMSLGSPEKYTDGTTTVDVKPLVVDDSWTKIPAVEGVPGQDASPEQWSKEGFENALVQPMIEDSSWVHNPAQQAVPAQAEYWESETEIVYENPNDETYVYHPAIAAQEAVLESWTKDSEIVYIQPMVIDSSWTYHAATEGIPTVPPVVEHWVKDGYEAQYSQPMKLDPAYSVIPEVKPGYKVIEDTEAKTSYEKEQLEKLTLLAIKNSCSEMIDFIIDYNMKNNSSEQIDTMEVAFADIFKYINSYRPNKVKPLLLATTDSKYSTLKDGLLAILAKYGF